MKEKLLLIVFPIIICLGGLLFFAGDDFGLDLVELIGRVFLLICLLMVILLG